MTEPPSRVRRPPRLIVRTLAVTFVVVLSAEVAGLLLLELRQHQPGAWAAIAAAVLWALGLAGVASLWLSHAISLPIHRLSREVSHIASERRFHDTLARTGTSRELDALAEAFNGVLRSLGAAQTEARATYVGAIKALATALDARDPYTAGHSERVSALSVAIGRTMQLADDQVEVLRLGALLHDIGKIGVSDEVLRKEGPLTRQEFDAIKSHPQVGARILRAVPFLAPHLEIVELHHERPDGLGYPRGLAEDAIPPLARIVRVADAFDAMTSARAYRPARSASEAMRELWRCAGAQFDRAAVQAFVEAWPSVAPALRRVPPPTGAPGRQRPLDVVAAGSVDAPAAAVGAR